tara:strand:+ start:1068 stop:1760 length:693 start_codon:yes stop_codon:yes gene_type:complete
MITKLEWDSNFFGFDIGKCIVEDCNGFNFPKFKEESNSYKLVYIISRERIEMKDIKLVDTKLTFVKEIKNNHHSYNDSNLNIFNASTDSFETLKKLAIASGEYSRFNVDSNFDKNDFESLYKQWIYNSVFKHKALKTIIYKENNKILGFSTLEKISDTDGNIGLVAVDINARGKKIGSKLIEHTISMAKREHLKNIQVVTQQHNLPAVNLYKNCGFISSKTEYIYHYWHL